MLRSTEATMHFTLVTLLSSFIISLSPTCITSTATSTSCIFYGNSSHFNLTFVNLPQCKILNYLSMLKIFPFYPLRPSCLKGVIRRKLRIFTSLSSSASNPGLLNRYISFFLAEAKTELEKRRE